METKDVILTLRTQKGLSQDELAERVYVTRQAVSRWENGETVPNTETLKAAVPGAGRVDQHPAGRAEKADLPVLRHAAGGCDPQPGAGRLLQ